MGLTATIKSGVAAGFQAAGDIKVSATFTEVSGTTYDPATGVNTESTTDYDDIEGFRRQYTAREIQAGIAGSGEIRFVAQADDFEFDPDVIDRVTIDDTVYQIQDYQKDAVGATYVFRLMS